MFVTQPLRRQSPLSDNDVEWMRSRVRVGTLLVSKGTLVALVASTTPAGAAEKGPSPMPMCGQTRGCGMESLRLWWPPASGSSRISSTATDRH